jgi:hypothetical protein
MDVYPWWNKTDLAKQIVHDYPTQFPEWEAITFTPYTLEEGEIIFAMNVPYCRLCATRHTLHSDMNERIVCGDLTLIASPYAEYINDTNLMTGMGRRTRRRYLEDINQQNFTTIHAAFMECIGRHPELYTFAHEGHFIDMDTLNRHENILNFSIRAPVNRFKFSVRYDCSRGWHYYLIDNEEYRPKVCTRYWYATDNGYSPLFHGENSLKSILKTYYDSL